METPTGLMISYELAKQLKDAGFPQAGHGGFATISPTREENMRVLVGEEPQRDRAYIPTLEELIQACGDKFWSLERDLDPDEIWGAYPANEIGDGPPAFGSTPTEAVARLWLALNK
jgi:hypothetical protein